MTCIVQQLKEKVNIKNPKKPGEVIVYSRGGVYVGAGNQPITLKILTEGVTFTNTGFVGETEQTIPAGISRFTTVSGICNIGVYTKYSLIWLSDGSSYGNIDVDQMGYTPNLEVLAFRYTGSSGNIGNLKPCTNLQRLRLVGADLTLDLSDLPDASSCYEFALLSDMSGTDPLNYVTGDISNLSRLDALVTLDLQHSKVSGNVSVFETLSSIRTVKLNGCSSISGDVGSFANHSGLWVLEIYDTAITGTLADLLVGTTGLKNAWLPDGVLYTAADLATADARCAANGGTPASSGHYVNGGTLVDSYPA